jgi:hypothetical protein
LHTIVAAIHLHTEKEQREEEEEEKKTSCFIDIAWPPFARPVIPIVPLFAIPTGSNWPFNVSVGALLWFPLTLDFVMKVIILREKHTANKAFCLVVHTVFWLVFFVTDSAT